VLSEGELGDSNPSRDISEARVRLAYNDRTTWLRYEDLATRFEKLAKWRRRI